LDSAFPDSLVGISRLGSMDAAFLAYYLRTQKHEMDRLAPRGTQKNINIQFLKPWPILAPPLDEQQKIAHILSAVDRKIEVEQKRKAALQELLKTMLHYFMTGKMRVMEMAASD
jgi:type I restriction enzyme, S subunit